ncbi:hypothetical protein KC335_g8 [Hortaea werneckii]|nr:hypothetical protein KC335_g8 [Hortaea werneckii]
MLRHSRSLQRNRPDSVCMRIAGVLSAGVWRCCARKGGRKCKAVGRWKGFGVRAIGVCERLWLPCLSSM